MFLAQDNAILGTVVTEEEIKSTAFMMGDLKVPGPDRFPGVFYHTFWDAIGSAIVKAVQLFFSTGKFPSTLNSTNLILIPKVSRPIITIDLLTYAISLTRSFQKSLLIALNLFLTRSLHKTKEPLS